VRPVFDGDDLDALGRIVHTAYTTAPGYPPDPEYDAELLDVAARARAAVVAVAEADDGRLVGCVTYVSDQANPMSEHDDPEAAAFRMLGVDPADQGRGAGRALVQWCIDQARSEGKRRLLIHSGVWMTRAHAMYRSMGFVARSDHDWEPVPGIKLLGFAYEIVDAEAAP
jgi:GNAT superfamily N-acetyltransferase